ARLKIEYLLISNARSRHTGYGGSVCTACTAHAKIRSSGQRSQSKPQLLRMGKSRRFCTPNTSFLPNALLTSVMPGTRTPGSYRTDKAMGGSMRNGCPRLSKHSYATIVDVKVGAS